MLHFRLNQLLSDGQSEGNETQSVNTLFTRICCVFKCNLKSKFGNIQNTCMKCFEMAINFYRVKKATRIFYCFQLLH